MTPKQPIGNDNHLVRVDKNIANNSEALAEDFNNNDELVTSILMYAAYKRKHSLFNEGIIDPADFAKRMGFADKYLTSVHPNPACFEGWSKEKIEQAYQNQNAHPEDPQYRVFDSRFENALYLLISRNITYRREGRVFTSQKNGTMKESIVTSVRLMKSFSIIFQQSKRGKKKLLYSYELDDSFSENLSLFYVTANINDFAMLRKKNLHRLYLYLKNLREISILKANPNIVLNFDLLCQLGGINSTAARDKKARLKSAISNIAEFIDMELDWKSHSIADRYKYIPVITFNEVKKLKATSILPPDKQNPEAEKVDIFATNLMLAVLKAYREEFGIDISFENDMQLVEGIIFNYIKKQSRDKVYNWYLYAQQHTFKDISYKTNENFNSFYKELGLLNSYEQIKSFLATLFHSNSKSNQPSNKPLTLEDLQREYAIVNFIEAQVTDSFITKQQQQGYKIVNVGGKFYACK